jgi:hypothetical protein
MVFISVYQCIISCALLGQGVVLLRTIYIQEGIKTMKKMLKGFVLAVIMTSLVFCMAACGRDTPESLAKEMFEIAERMRTHPMEYLELRKRHEELGNKVSKLSPQKQEDFQEEYMRFVVDAADRVRQALGEIEE